MASHSALLDIQIPVFNSDTSDHISSTIVPITDIRPFTSDKNDPEAQERAAHDLANKASLNGCVGITGHGVPPELLAEAFSMTKKLFDLFDLPHTEKMKAPHPDAPVPHRSYSSIGRENAVQKTESED